MAEIQVKARSRKPGGKGAAKRLRAGGKIPAVVYGKGIDPIPIELDARDVYSLTHGARAASLESVIVSLEIEDEGEDSRRPTLITEIQHDPIKGNVLHIDFHQVSLTERIHARIPVVTVGECPGVSEGGIVEHTLRELDVACRAMDLPEEVRVDISRLGLGESLHVGDIDLGPNIEILNDAELSVVSVTVPRVAVEVAAAEVEVEKEEEVVEPEVIGEKEAEEEEEGEAAKRKKEE